MGSLADALSSVLPLYEIPDNDLVGEVLIPAMSVATTVAVGAGYFSSGCLAQVSPGLAAYITASHHPLKLLISPEISADDAAAMERGARSSSDVITEIARKIFSDGSIQSALVSHTLDCLSYLVGTQRLEIRFVLMKQGRYHKKVWLFGDGTRTAAVHGSGNATSRGLLVNGEQMTVDRPWHDGPSSAQRVQLLEEQWIRQWDNNSQNSLSLSVLQGLPFALRARSLGRVPTLDDFWEAWRRDHDAGLEPPLPPNVRNTPPHMLAVPSHIEWREGRYRHQSRAVDAILQARGRGVVQIATGGGKTRTALIAATEVQNSDSRPLLVVVLVPTDPLAKQWLEEVKAFGVEAFNPGDYSGQKRTVMLQELTAALSTSDRRTEVLVVTNKLFTQDHNLRRSIRDLPSRTRRLLIGDEMHNLGVPTFLNDPPNEFDYRIGLSATPIRQYDPDGTSALFGYFGPPIFEFGLGDAIAAGCLCPYEYHIHEAPLTGSENDKYVELSENLRRAGYRKGDDDGQTVNMSAEVERLLRQRRAILEQAGTKLNVLRHLLEEVGPQSAKQSLIYASAKESVLEPERQLLRVNALLAQLGIIYHQFTNVETARRDGRTLLERFAKGDFQVLTAMKVLDEGVDMPEVRTAYVLASSSVRREWVQRRGRILRIAPGKSRAVIHDFIVLPTDLSCKDWRSIVRAELSRADEFAHLADNEWVDDGPRARIRRIEERMYKGAGQ